MATLYIIISVNFNLKGVINMAKIIALFNNNGGVSKTTTFHLG